MNIGVWSNELIQKNILKVIKALDVVCDDIRFNGWIEYFAIDFSFLKFHGFPHILGLFA